MKKIDPKHLHLIQYFADKNEVTKQYISKLIKDGKFEKRFPGNKIIPIDGIPHIYIIPDSPERLPEAGEPSQEPKKDTKFKPI